jgi:hypothetical protein
MKIKKKPWMKQNFEEYNNNTNGKIKSLNLIGTTKN